MLSIVLLYICVTNIHTWLCKFCNHNLYSTRLSASCVLSTSMVECQLIPSIDPQSTLKRYSIDPRFSLDQHLIDILVYSQKFLIKSYESVNTSLAIDRLPIECPLSVSQDVNWVTIECQPSINRDANLVLI